MPKNPSVIFATGPGSVTGSNFVVTAPSGYKFLVDCGLVQGAKVALEENHLPFTYNPAEMKALLVTHAHLDHVGRIPKLVKEGFNGVIYSTPETKALAELVINDAVGILANEVKQTGGEPLYRREDADRVFPLWKTMPYHESFSLAPDVKVFFKDAGHILGSSMIELTLGGGASGQNETKVLFTGDLGNSPAPLLRDTEEVGDVDYLITESTYGDRNHEPKEQRLAKLESVIKDTIGRGGTLIIPSFSIDRTQVILYELNNMVEEGRIKSVPIFVDSPMAISATQIYRSSKHLFNDVIQEQIRKGDDIFNFPRLDYAVSQNESRGIDSVKGAKIILAGSGMSVGGRIVGHEEHFLPDPNSTLLLVGYQSIGSLGRALAEGTKKVHIHGHEVVVRAKVETLYGYSAHKDSDHLVEFVSTATKRLKKVFVILGEPSASMHLAQRLNDELEASAMVPVKGEEYELN